MSKVFEFLDKIEANDKRRIERIDKEKQSMIESLKKFRKEREKLVPQLKKAMEKRKKDHDEFFELKKKYQAAAEEKIKENEKIHADLLAGRISVAKHQATYKKPADVRAEFDEKFFAEFEKTLDLLRGHDLEIKKLELDILKLDAKITQFEGTVFDIEEKITKEKLGLQKVQSREHADHGDSGSCKAEGRGIQDSGDRWIRPPLFHRCEKRRRAGTFAVEFGFSEKGFAEGFGYRFQIQGIRIQAERFFESRLFGDGYLR